MAVVIDLHSGIRDFEMEAYFRLLERNGVNVADADRAIGPATKDRWLFAWHDAPQAEAFATQLRRESDNSDWTAYRIDDEDVSRGPLGPIEILVSRQIDGSTYSLSPISRRLILTRFPRTKLVPNVFIGASTQSDYQTIHGAIWDQIAIILTGLSHEQFEHLGGFRVVDPIDRRILHDAPPLAV